MLLNEDKCQFMIIESSNISRNNKAKIKIENKFKEVNKRKLLGITFDNKITMSEHIKHMQLSRQVTNCMHLLRSLTT